MVSNATFNNISVISWLSVLLVEKTGVPKEKTTTLSQVTNKLCHILLYILDLDWEGFEYLTLVVIGTDCIGSHKSNYHMITTTTAHKRRRVSMVCQHIFNWEFVSTWLYLQYSLVPDQSMLYWEFVSTWQYLQYSLVPDLSMLSAPVCIIWHFNQPMKTRIFIQSVETGNRRFKMLSDVHRHQSDRKPMLMH